MHNQGLQGDGGKILHVYANRDPGPVRGVDGNHYEFIFTIDKVPGSFAQFLKTHGIIYNTYGPDHTGIRFYLPPDVVEHTLLQTVRQNKVRFDHQPNRPIPQQVGHGNAAHQPANVVPTKSSEQQHHDFLESFKNMHKADSVTLSPGKVNGYAYKVSYNSALIAEAFVGKCSANGIKGQSGKPKAVQLNTEYKGLSGMF